MKTFLRLVVTLTWQSTHWSTGATAIQLSGGDLGDAPWPWLQANPGFEPKTVTWDNSLGIQVWEIGDNPGIGCTTPGFESRTVTWDSSLGISDWEIGDNPVVLCPTHLLWPPTWTLTRTSNKDRDEVEKPGKDPPSCACLYAVAIDVDTDENEHKDRDEVERPGKDPPSCACLYAVAIDVDTDENEHKDRDEVERPGKDPPSCACLYAVATNVDADENEIKNMVTDIGTDRNQIADVVKTKANDRDCVGAHLTPETLLKHSGREETDGEPRREPRRGRRPRDRGWLLAHPWFLPRSTRRFMPQSPWHKTHHREFILTHT